MGPKPRRLSRPAGPARFRGSPTPEPVYARDAELLKACRQGDEAAWRELLRRYRDFLYSIPRRYGLDQDDAADVFQNVSLALWKGLPELRSEKALTRWIEITARRQCERLAGKKRRLVHDEEGLADRPAEEPDTLHELAELQEQQIVRRSLEKLGGRCAELLRLLYMENPPAAYDEITRRLGLPHGSIGPTRGRCLEKLREIVKKG